MELPTYTSIWRIEKRLYKLYDFRLPMPLPVGQIAVFTAITVPYVILLTLFGLPFSHTLFWLYVLPPGVLTWLATRPVLESKRLPELIISQVRYLGEPSGLVPDDAPRREGRDDRGRAGVAAQPEAAAPLPSRRRAVPPSVAAVPVVRPARRRAAGGGPPCRPWQPAGRAGLAGRASRRPALRAPAARASGDARPGWPAAPRRGPVPPHSALRRAAALAPAPVRAPAATVSRCPLVPACRSCRWQSCGSGQRSRPPAPALRRLSARRRLRTRSAPAPASDPRLLPALPAPAVPPPGWPRRLPGSSPAPVVLSACSRQAPAPRHTRLQPAAARP